MPLTVAGRMANYLRQNYALEHQHGRQNSYAWASGMALSALGEQRTVRLTARQQRRIRHKLRHAAPSAGQRERRTVRAAARAALVSARRTRRAGL